jgi:hypothetical protein
MGHRQLARQQVWTTAVDSAIGGGIIWVCDWEGFTNALVAATNATATAVVAVAIAAADKSMTAASQAASQPLHTIKPPRCCTLTKGKLTKRIGMNYAAAEEKWFFYHKPEKSVE